MTSPVSGEALGTIAALFSCPLPSMDLVRGVLGERKQLYLVFTALYKIQLKNNVIFVAKKNQL